MRKHFLGFCFVFILLTSCTPQSSDPAGLQAWIDAPLPGSTIPLAPYQIVAHSSDPVRIQVLEISIDGDILEVIDNPNPANLLFSAQISWTPPSPGVYLIQARGKNSSGVWSRTAQATVIVEEEFQPPPLELLPSATPEQLVVSCEAQITAAMNTTCRQGPSTYHEPVFYLLEGDTASIQGGNQDQSWWAVLPESQTDPCWVSTQTVTPTCLPDEVEKLDSPPFITRVNPSHDEFYWGDNPLRSVTIQALCGGESPVTGVTLIYRVTGKAEWYSVQMTPSEAGFWQAQILAHNITGYKTISSAVIEYYLEAANQAGLTTRSPLFNNLRLKDEP